MTDTTDTTGVAGKLAQRAADVEAADDREHRGPTLAELINRQRDQIERALPKHMDADRLARIMVTQCRTTPKLLECSPASVLGALMLSAQTGLEPGPLGHAYLVPRWNGKQKQLECQWQIGYKGIVELARRSGKLRSIEARAVYERDRFAYRYGLDEQLEHEPYMGADRGELVAVWGLAKFVDGGHYFVVLGRAEIDEAMMRSDAGAKGFGPWKDDYAAMARKTAIRRMAPYLPLSAEEANVLTHDEQVSTRLDLDPHDEAASSWLDVRPEQPAIEATVSDADEVLEADEAAADEVAEAVDADTLDEPELPAEAVDVGDVSWAGPPPARDDDADRMNQKQSRALHAQLRNVYDAAGDDRFPVLSAILQRPVGSTRELSFDDASFVLDVLNGEPVPDDPNGGGF